MPALIANARMYAVTPTVRDDWRTLFTWVARRTGIELTYVEHAAPAPLEALWARDDLGAAFMCGFPFASAPTRPMLVAAAVPSSPRYAGRPCYCTDLVVRADSRFARLADTFGGCAGFTVDHSQSGFHAFFHHLRGYDGAHPDRLFARWAGPLFTPRRVIEAVLAGEIDVGPLDSYVHDLLRRHEPQTAARLRTVASTEMTPNPPLIASRAVADTTVRSLREALQAAATESELAPLLDRLLLAGFAAVEPDAYETLLAQAWRRTP